MKTITRNKRPDELPFTFEQIDANGARFNVWSSKETNQRLIDNWVKKGAYIRTTPNNRIELTVTKEVFTEHEQSIIDAWEAGKIVQYKSKIGGLWIWIDKYTKAQSEAQSENRRPTIDWKRIFIENPEWRIKPEEWVPTSEQQAIIDHGLKHGEGSLQMKCKDGTWLTFSFSKEVSMSMEFWEWSFKDYKIRINPGEGWRLLETGEFFKRGDEFLGPDGLWAEVFRVDVRYDSQYHYKTRRRIKPTLRLMRPNEFPAVWWVLITANRRKEEIQSWCLVTEVNSKYFCYRERGILDWLYVDKTCIWSPDRKEEKSFFVEDVK